MIEAYIGKMRSGKTYAMTARVLHLLDHGEVVYTNYRIKWDPLRPMSPARKLLHVLGIWPKRRYPSSNLRLFRNWEEIMNQTHCTIALDEGWQYFDSYQKLPIEKRARLYQSGKRHLSFLYTVQRYMMADINLRWSTDLFHESRLVKIPFLLYPLLIYKTYDLAEDDEGAKLAKTAIQMDGKGGIKEVDMSLKTRWLFAKQRIFDAYDTEEDIYATEQDRSRLGAKHKATGDDSCGYIDPLPTVWAVLKGKAYATRRTSRGSGRRPQERTSPVVASVHRRSPAYQPSVAARQRPVRVIRDVV